MKLNLGCGDTPMAGWINVDSYPGPGVFLADLNLDWPWRDSSVTHARAWHLFEHLYKPVHVMNELWRVLMPDAMAEIQVPTVDSFGAFASPVHVSYWHRRTFLHFEDGTVHRERWGTRDGIVARFRTVKEHVDHTEDGINLTIWLQAVK